MIATNQYQSSSDGQGAAPTMLTSPASGPSSERVRHIVIGSPEGVQEAIHRLHVLNYVEQIHWTRLFTIPAAGVTLRPELGEVFSYLDRQRRRR